jgi:hypothetical protein
MTFNLNSTPLTSPDVLFKPKITRQPDSTIIGNNQLTGLSTGVNTNHVLAPNDTVNYSPMFNKPAKPVLTNISLEMFDLPEIVSGGSNSGNHQMVKLASLTNIGVTTLTATGNNQKLNTTLTGIPARPTVPERSRDEFLQSIKGKSPVELEQIASTEILSGSEFLEVTKNMSAPKREQAILAQVLKGNVPDFNRQMKEVNVSITSKDGKVLHTGTIMVAPDYLAIGSDKDFIRMPMSPLTAQKIANQTGTSLPTRKIVKDIYAQAEVQLPPKPMDPISGVMESNDYYGRNNKLIETERAKANGKLGQLTAGHKKDVVISNILEEKPGKVAIYGWQMPGGAAIQPLSNIHHHNYADYSHGIRLIQGKMLVDGKVRDIAEVLQDKDLAALLSDEGRIKSPKIKLP